MIVITTQIQHVVGKGVSIATISEANDTTPIEEQVKKIIDVAISAAGEIMTQDIGNGSIVHGGEILVNMVKERMRSEGVKFDGTPAGKILEGRG